MYNNKEDVITAEECMIKQTLSSGHLHNILINKPPFIQINM